METASRHPSPIRTRDGYRERKPTCSQMIGFGETAAGRPQGHSLNGDIRPSITRAMDPRAYVFAISSGREVSVALAVAVVGTALALWRRRGVERRRPLTSLQLGLVVGVVCVLGAPRATAAPRF